MEDQIKCPKCASTQISADKKGFSGKKAVAGAILTGGIGLLAGTIGSNKTQLTCLKCGKTFKIGEDLESVKKKNAQAAQNMQSPVFWIVMIVICVLIFWGCNSCSHTSTDY